MLSRGIAAAAASVACGLAGANSLPASTTIDFDDLDAGNYQGLLTTDGFVLDPGVLGTGQSGYGGHYHLVAPGDCNKVKSRAEGFANKWLVAHMLQGNAQKAQEISKRLADVKQYNSHGMVIDHAEAKKMGLTVEYQDPDQPLWSALWKLHSAYDVMCRQAPGLQKVMESRRVSLLL